MQQQEILLQVKVWVNFTINLNHESHPTVERNCDATVSCMQPNIFDILAAFSVLAPQIPDSFQYRLLVEAIKNSATMVLKETERLMKVIISSVVLF
jgi:hypothetical protein